jgi:hypothetical protein
MMLNTYTAQAAVCNLENMIERIYIQGSPSHPFEFAGLCQYGDPAQASD